MTSTPPAVSIGSPPSPYTPDEATRKNNQKPYVVLVEMETFTGPNIERRFERNAGEVLKSPGVKFLHQLSCKQGVQVVLVHHNNVFATVAEAIHTGAKLDGTALSPQFQFTTTRTPQENLHEQLAQAFGVSIKDALFIGHSYQDTNSAEQDGMRSVRLFDDEGLHESFYISGLHQQLILDAVTEMKAQPQ